MFGYNYRNDSSTFYTGLIVGGLTGMAATIWFMGKDHKDHVNGTMLNKDNINRKIKNFNDKEKDEMFNKFIDPNEDEHELLDEFSKQI